MLCVCAFYCYTAIFLKGSLGLKFSESLSIEILWGMKVSVQGATGPQSGGPAHLHLTDANNRGQGKEATGLHFSLKPIMRNNIDTVSRWCIFHFLI